MHGFWFRSSLKKVIPANDRLETRSRSIQHGKSTRSAPEVFPRGFATRVFGLRQKTGRRAAENVHVARDQKSSGTQGMSTITSDHNGSNT